ncbi:hypothetical protein [Deinococcus sp. NW-56]|uniref:hypothetical protein n=1 Tax=Deinococcus sp. NW-56 TaxID=2080419 RepID=UPI001F399991|nr:hypothetical protein [Deinococcus sp. NW-56]
MILDWREHASARRARPPQVRGAVARPRLLALLNSARVLSVVAPAGYGKTTALAAHLPELGRSAWLTLDVDDADPQVFVAGLAVAVAGLPGGEGPGALLDAGATPRRVAARVADVLDAAGALLVLDEAGHLAGPLAGDVLRELLGGRVALLSRLPLEHPALTRLEAEGELRRLSAPDLAFTRQELGALLAAQGVVASAEEVRLAHTLTEGWPIAARFLAQAAAQGRVPLSALAELDGGEAQLATLFTYLAQEVLGPLDPALRALLTRGSVFEELSPGLLEAVLDVREAATLLGALERGGTFLTRTGETYRAHPLLRAHLRGLLSPGEAREVAARGADYFERTGRPRRALAAHLQAGNTARAAELLAHFGGRWLEQGRVTLVGRSLARLPGEAWTPALYALSGDARRLSSRYAEALAAYAQADPLARALGEAQVALDTVQPDHAWAALDTAAALAPDEDTQARIARMRAENHLNAGDLARALELAPALARGHATLCAPVTWGGRWTSRWRPRGARRAGRGPRRTTARGCCSPPSCTPRWASRGRPPAVPARAWRRASVWKAASCSPSRRPGWGTRRPSPGGRTRRGRRTRRPWPSRRTWCPACRWSPASAWLIWKAVPGT